MKNIAIFHHVYQVGDWEQIYTDQVISLQKSGLFDAADYLYIGVSGNKRMPFDLQKTNKLNYAKDGGETEYCTMKALYDYSCLKDCYVLFLHTKGVTWSVSKHGEHLINTPIGGVKTKTIYENTQRWRKYLEYFLIDNWGKSVKLLEHNDIAGTEWVDDSLIEKVQYNIPHYSGGMWWANSNYIKTLDANFITNNMIIGRYATELWVGTKSPKYHNFYTSNKNLYLYEIDEREYRGLV